MSGLLWGKGHHRFGALWHMSPGYFRLGNALDAYPDDTIHEEEVYDPVPDAPPPWGPRNKRDLTFDDWYHRTLEWAILTHLPTHP